MVTCDLVLIVPCFNEASRLDPQEFLEFIRQHPSVRLIFVDDGSEDGTAAIHDRMAAEEPRGIAVMRLDRNRGKAEAVRLGLLEALTGGPALVGFWDADLATPLEAVDDFLSVAVKYPGIDIILGSRVMLMGRDIRRKATRHYLGRVFATAASVALGLPVYDTQCGAKVFRANEAMRRVFSVPFRSAWIFDVEILARYLEAPLDDGGTPRRSRIYELTVPAWHDVPGSKLRTSDFVRSIVDLVAIWRDRRAGRAASSRKPPGPSARQG